VPIELRGAPLRAAVLTRQRPSRRAIDNRNDFDVILDRTKQHADYSPRAAPGG
jgi:hypothetical protein